MTAAQIRAQQSAAFQRINGLTDLQVKQLSDFCMKRSDFNPLAERAIPSGRSAALRVKPASGLEQSRQPLSQGDV